MLVEWRKPMRSTLRMPQCAGRTAPDRERPGTDTDTKGVHPMNAFTSKKTIVGASALAVTGLVTAGFAAPAFADHEGSTTESTSTVTEGQLTNDLLGDITGETTLADLLDGSVDGLIGDITGGSASTGGIGIDGLLGDITGGDVTGGDAAVGSIGGDITGGDTAVGNGDISNESPVVVAPEVGDVASGNAIGSGNDVDAPIGSGNETNVDLGDVVDVNDIVDSTLDEVNVDGIVDDVMAEIDLDSFLD